MNKKSIQKKIVALSVQNISKSFRVPHEKISTLRSAFTNIFKKKSHDVLHALKDVSFEIKKGEFFGIIGRNGSGKSTLLKILAGVYTADSGSIEINGAISPFLELGIGFNPELSGRDNIYLNATVLGLTKKQIDEKFDSIVAFSELERFIDQKLKNYSSGMHVRLAFSVSIHANRDILLMDEVLAVGDALFQVKCMRELHRYRKENKTVILVSHDLSAIEQYCDRALLLREGSVISTGDARKVSQIYRNQTAEDSEKGQVALVRNDSEKKNSKAKITEISFEDPELGKRHVFVTGADLVIRVSFDQQVRSDESFNVGISLFNDKHNYMFGVNTIIDKRDCSVCRKRGYFELIYKNIPLRAGGYYVLAALMGESNRVIYDIINQSHYFEVVSLDNNEGSVAIEYDWNV